jgi:opacity protein-like surface antigen
MRTIIVAAIALVFAASAALAQNPPANDGPNNKAINSKSEDNPGAPVAGANSFTEGQAQSRIEAKGYTNVGSLKKDTKGVWRGTAMRDGKSVDVSLDFEGNIVAR